MSAGGGDACLVLQNAGGSQLARDDNVRGAGTATLGYDVRRDTQYRILAASRRANRFGAYTLRLSEGAVLTVDP